jgi:hypothetical protein
MIEIFYYKLPYQLNLTINFIDDVDFITRHDVELINSINFILKYVLMISDLAFFLLNK